MATDIVNSAYNELQQCIKNCSLIPRLEEISLTCIAISLWTSKDIKNEIKRAIIKPLTNEGKKIKWRCVESRIINKTKNLPLHQMFTTDFNYITANLNTQILEWAAYVSEIMDTYNPDVKDIAWTVFGTIDKEKTLRLIVKNGSPDNLSQFLILKRRFEYLWGQLPTNLQRRFKTEIMPDIEIPDPSDKEVSELSMNEIVFLLFWLFDLWALKSEKNGSSEEVDETISSMWHFLQQRFKVDMFYFLLTNSSEETLKSIITHDTRFLVSRFTVCVLPWQVNFLPFVEKLVPLLGQDDLVEVIGRVLAYGTDSRLCGATVKRFFMCLWRMSGKSVRDAVLKAHKVINVEDLTKQMKI